MDVTPFLFSAALIGTAVTTTGMFLFINAHRQERKLRRGFASRHGFVASGLISAGAAIVMVAWYLWPKSPDPAFDPNALLRDAPPAAIPASPPDSNGHALAGREWVLLIWGIPNDNALYTPEAELAFNRKLAGLISQSLAKNSRSPKKIQTRLLSREESNIVAQIPAALENWCKDHPAALVLTLRLAGYLIDDSVGQAWLEPHYRLVDCQRLSVRSHIGRVKERPGDSFPYQQALREDFRRALGEFHGD